MKKCLFILALAAGTSVGLWTTFSRPAESTRQAQIVEHHLRALAHGDYQAREEAHAALALIGSPATPFIIRALDNRPGPVEQIVTRLGQHFPWLGVQPSTDHQLRARAAEQLASKTLCAHPDAVPALIRALADEHSTVAEEAQRSLRRIGPQATLPQLTRALRSRDEAIRFQAVEVLRDFGPTAVAAAPDLRHLLRDRKSGVRAITVRALGRIAGPAAAPDLMRSLDDRNSFVRSAAAASLGAMGKSAAPSAPKLRSLLADSSLGVRIEAARALWQVTGDTTEAVPVLIRALVPGVWDAALALGSMGAAASNAVPALVTMMKREKVPRPLRETPVSALALGQIGAAAVPALIPLLQDADPRIRTSAALALGFAGAHAREATPHLVAVLGDPSADVRRAATLSLGTIDPARKELVPALIEMANDEDIFLSSLASAALERVDPEAAAAVVR